MNCEKLLPESILKRAALRGNEYAWPIADIPEVIEAARDAGLISIGGQLQFRLPQGKIFERYWIEVDTYKSVSQELPWTERVTRTAEVALAQFEMLQSKYDFLEEGKEYPADAMCFVWYVLDEEEAARIDNPTKAV
jgi:hypothetical protein